MNKPSERIVVFVTTAQKRAITVTAENLGISVSELMRRAVLSFGATSEQVKAASIVDRLRAPRAPDALNAALQRVARGTRHARAALPAALQARDDSELDASASLSTSAAEDAAATAAASTGASTSASTAAIRSAGSSRAASTPKVLPPTLTAAEPAPLLPAGIAAALAAEADEEAAATAEAVARVAAAKAATEGSAPPQVDTDSPLRSVLKRPRLDTARDDDDPCSDPSTEGGRFA
ncbi:hypothetical protein [Paraburkholderia metrosideri]|jgi:hypothetical protein|uniref:Ribbon-helix-helix protein CopG domain-containing protein n=1 Tax=Paraburkholderia metrosideri TaxID=580937 RepID=A0ABN7HTF6_9BURK|nr:hypothetical protein [Paraburkholderia metrosideri]CAD6534881.1 hypothetical protein LMG28140_02860 [Paraburkholderia metrosideri]